MTNPLNRHICCGKTAFHERTVVFDASDLAVSTLRRGTAFAGKRIPRKARVKLTLQPTRLPLTRRRIATTLR
jgi:hypothetical protein